MKNKSISEISKIIAETCEQNLIHEFLLQILTKDEVNEVAKRWELLKLLRQGMSQRNIAKKLKISLCKITRGSRELKKEDSALSVFVSRASS